MKSAIVAMFVVCAACGAAGAEPARIDPRLVGTWTMNLSNASGTWTLVFEPQPGGRYRTRAKGPAKVSDETGVLAAANGAWRIRKDTGAVEQGTYAFADDDTVTFSAGAGSVTWHRVGKAATPTPTPTPTPKLDGDADALYQRANALMNQNRYRDALPLLTEAANRGHSTAQHMLGFVLQGGAQGVPKDEAAAAGWFAKAAAQGNRASQYALAGMIEEGEGGLEKDPKRAAELYEASAKQGFEKAQFAFGLSCEFVLNDRKRAIYYLELAAKQGEGGAHWIAEWLRRPGTPHLKNEAALGAYVNGQVAAWMASSAPAADTTITKYYHDRIQMFYSQGDTAAGDRCKYHGSCY